MFLYRIFIHCLYLIQLCRCFLNDELIGIDLIILVHHYFPLLIFLHKLSTCTFIMPRLSVPFKFLASIHKSYVLFQCRIQSYLPNNLKITKNKLKVTPFVCHFSNKCLTHYVPFQCQTESTNFVIQNKFNFWEHIYMCMCVHAVSSHSAAELDVLWFLSHPPVPLPVF